MKSAMKRAAGGVALTMVLIRGFCGGGVFLGYLGIEGLLLYIATIRESVGLLKSSQTIRSSY